MTDAERKLQPFGNIAVTAYKSILGIIDYLQGKGEAYLDSAELELILLIFMNLSQEQKVEVLGELVDARREFWDYLDEALPDSELPRWGEALGYYVKFGITPEDKQ